MKKKVLLIILDGYGSSNEENGNAITEKTSPFIFDIFNKYPHSLLSASGESVGLPSDQIGNSEVGHLTIGAGRIVYTGLSLINKEIETNKICENKVLLDAINFSIKNKSDLHILGLLSSGGVHSNENHIFELIKIANKKGIKPIIHIFGDGRDVSPKSIKTNIKKLKEVLKTYGGTIGTICGRFYSMDRDKRWERVNAAYENLLGISGKSFADVEKYIDDQYSKNIFDEFIEPAHLENFDNFIKDNDSIIFANFRPDRARELSHLICGSNLYQEKPTKTLKNIYFATMMSYEGIKPSGVIYPSVILKKTLGEIISENGLKQLRIAETEKYAHVTFFIDGGIELDLKNEEKILVPSPKVSNYKNTPKMSAVEITNKLLDNLNKFDFIILNFANADMVGHTGDFEKTKEAIKCVDDQIERIYNFSKNNNTTMFITADHGNAEEMFDKKNNIITRHSTNLVPFIITDKSIEINSKGSLANIAPTILDYLDIDIPKEMNEKSLIKNKLL